MKTNVVYMGAVRELLSELDKLRADVLTGEATGWGGSVFYADGREVVYLGGSIRHNAQDQARAMLKVSAQRVLREDVPPKSAGIR
jgi:hypothetical protein